MTALAPELPADGLVLLTDEEIAAATEDERRRYYEYLTQELHKRDPVAWGEAILREQWWSMQRRIARSVAVNRRTAVRSCHESGKSFTAARIACWWLDTGTPGKRFVVSTAPTGDLVKAILWREINQAHKKGGLPGRTNLTEWYIDGEIVAMGRKPNDYEPNNFVGVHAPEGVLVIYDEGGGIPEALYVAGHSMAGNTVSRELAIGNPDDPSSHFAELFKPGSSWEQIHISYADTPNFTDEEVSPEVAGSLISQEYVDDMRRDHGVTSPFYVSKVLGEFPRNRSDGMIPFSWVQACRVDHIIEPTGDCEFGIDVGASEDGDPTVVWQRIGMTAIESWSWTLGDPMATVGEIVDLIRERKPKRVKVDSIGVGYGVWGRLREVCEDDPEIDCEVIAVGVGESAGDDVDDADAKTPKQIYKNLKARIWWEIGRELSRDHAWNLAACSDFVIEELTEHRYTKDSAGRIKVESKDDVKKRLKRSPNDADALLLAFYDPPSAEPEFLGAA